ncbi:hypothetical protein [Bdellovibrio sp. HCB274]|uniref:hypothetical protein n=1 Tax=Bdellovibrio sp. HCB274 TaxID=3394361 RepID=UPI0039B53DE0
MFKRGSLLLSSVLCTAFFAESAFAADSMSTTIHHQYQAPRALGMGDAFIAVADDYTAIFYNPAGLARRESGQVNLSMSFAGTPGAKDFYDEYKEIEDSSLSEVDKNTAYINLIERHYGDNYSVRITPMEGVWVRPKWGVAFIPADVSVQLQMHRSIAAAIDTKVYADSTLALSYADDLNWFNNGRFSMGLTAKFVNRGFYSKIIQSTDLATSDQIVRKEDLSEGYTIDADIGMLWTPEIPSEGFFSFLQMARPTFGAVVRNVAETGFNNSLKLINKEEQTVNPVPEKLYRVFDIGSRWEYPSAWIFGGRGVLDVRDLGHPDFNWRKGVHAGLEFDWFVYSWWKGHYRVGLSQGYWTAGLSAELGIFNLDLVSYADDVGTRNTPVESRVYATRLNLDF